MAGMELDSPGGSSPRLSPRDRIVQRLTNKGVPREALLEHQRGLALYLKDNKARISELVACILPTEDDISELPISLSMFSREGYVGSKAEDLFNESMSRLGWLMFEAEPQEVLDNLANRTGGRRAVCGAVWGHNDLAYRCRTCENDPTCAICVPCFQNGNHKDHDYSIIYTGGGCCDCGDVTAWKREGFCSEHRGTEQIQPLPKELVTSIKPALDALLVIWKCKVTIAEKSKSREQNMTDPSTVIGNQLSLAIVEMLLDFCNCSESLLCFISGRMFGCTGLLDVLVKAERFLYSDIVKKLHELLLKLLGEPVFKYEFAKVFIRYYPVAVSEMTKEGTEKMLDKYPLLSTFSVQIFTVPTLTQRLVQEVNLLGVLLGCLRDLLLSCSGEAGHVLANTWLMEIMIRLVEDTRFVLSHDEINAHITHEQPDILRAWLKILTLAQGMNPQKRGTTSPIEDEYEYHSTSFMLGQLLSNVHNLLIQGSFSSVEDKERKYASSCCPDTKSFDGNEGYRHSKVGRTSEESSACSSSSRSGGSGYSSKYCDVKLDGIGCLYIPSHSIWLISECLKSIDGWLCQARNISRSIDDDADCCCFNSFRKKVSRLKKGTNSYKVCRASLSRQGKDGHQLLASSESLERFDSMDTDMCNEHISSSTLSDDNLVEVDACPECEAFGVLNMADWPDIFYDVSSQDISFHIPLHRLLSLLLRKAMEYCYGEMGNLEKATNGFSLPSSASGYDFFGQVLGGVQPCAFSAFLMEHPVQLRVFCAQVRAGMWRRNGDTAIFLTEFYRAVQWFGQGLESDLFLLQICAALAPPDMFIERVQERYGLLNYTSLNIAEHNEYEAVLVHEMLTLIIQIVKERRFSGLTFSDNLKREIIYKLAAGDATHSQVVRALPRDLSKSDQVQKVLDTLATYSNPSGMKQGKYSLRQAYWKELDLYHPRWSYRDLQMAEERYFHFCKVSARNIQLPRWTNIYYPLRNVSRIAVSKTIVKILRAVFFYAAFTDVSPVSRAPDGVLITALHLLSLSLDICGSQNQTSINSYIPDYCSSVEVSNTADDLSPFFTYVTEDLDVTGPAESVLYMNQNMLSLLVLLMRKYKEESDIILSETRHCNISSLIETLLKKFAELNNDCFIMLQKLAPEVVCHMLKQSAQIAQKSSASASDAEDRRAKARERQAAVMEKMRAQQARFIASMKSTNNEADVLMSKEEKMNLEDPAPEESPIICSLCRDPHSQSPLCYLILLQKSCLTTFVERGPLSWEDGGWRDEIRSTVIEPSSNPSGADQNSMLQWAQNLAAEFPLNMEPAEVDKFLAFLREQFSDVRSTQALNMLPGTGTEVAGPLDTLEDDIFHSVVRDIHNSKSIADALGGERKYLSRDVLVSPRKGRIAEFLALGECVAQLAREPKQNRSSMYGLQRIAKLSRSIASTASTSRFGPTDCDGIHISSCGHAVHHECYERYLLSLKQRYNRRHGFEGSHIVDPDQGELLCPVCRRFANSILPAPIGASNRSMRKTSVVSSSIPNDHPSTLSDTNCSNLHVLLALSLIQNAARIAGQSDKKLVCGTLNGMTNLALEPALKKLYLLYYPHNYDSLSETARLSQSLILWDTLRYSVMCTEIMSRAKLNANSAVQSCFESLNEELHTSSGYMMSVLLHVSQTTRHSNCFEVLLRFSSLQLLAGSICAGVSGDNQFSNGDKQKGTISLFDYSHSGEAFPDIQFWKRAADPILAQDPFSSLMWVLFCLPVPFIFSRECFVALVHLFYIVCVIQSMIACYGKQNFNGSSFGGRLSEVCRTMAESQFMRQYFVSSYINQHSHPIDTIRRLTFPYLRRCALFWNLLNCSTISPLYDTQTWERSFLSSKDAEIDSDNHHKVELERIKELEDMFKICALELVFKDEVVHTLALRWCEHLQEEFAVRNYRGSLVSTPAVPFKLIELPLIYQDLLQRYIKLPCPNCKSVPEEPALCLICGKLCSLSRKSCCRTGKCSNHALTCGAGIGVFLLVRKTVIFLQRSARQAFWPSPYLDAFGEEDHEMSRGKPLYLSKERYAALTYLVASHGLDRCSEVLRQTTITLNAFE